MTPDAVVVDTNVFSAVLTRRLLASQYAEYLSGKRLIISFQTVAEIRFGGMAAGWGEARMREAERAIAKAATIPPHDELATEWASLRVECKRVGHALASKTHMSDLWIAATASLIGIPLVSHDAIFKGTPGLTVLTLL
ncbi:MAG: PIN domain-containing protein [Acidimicrobiia bacterium]|nr:PIN domain-containing protein [Acidimicrobiia bacterium]